MSHGKELVVNSKQILFKLRAFYNNTTQGCSIILSLLKEKEDEQGFKMSALAMYSVLPQSKLGLTNGYY
ncbi:hypothetical protein P5673_019342 [Acropora cervicornis]|uniref:Uncharacterized protein n=1 Tax=Acropora cervicornis TaxID=6130 RepID=A0AAD9QBE9_ACRCE|nr:hypothetical protein P5673_019342 [Acropora cervicornis]